MRSKLLATRWMLAVALAVIAQGLIALPAGATTPTVVLNEVNCEGIDWIELVNVSDAAADVSGWLLTDDPLDRDPLRPDHRFVFPAGATIAPGEKRVVQKVETGFPFGVSCGSDTIRLANGTGTLEDEFAVPTLAATGDTWGRYPDGTGSWVETAPTEGAANEPSTSGGGPVPDASWVFDPSAVPVVDLTLPQTTIDALNTEPKTEYHDATFTLTRGPGQTYGPLAIGVRLKGGLGSFRGLDGKAAFKLKFNHSVAGQRFQGLKKLTLNNMVQDHSMVHETLSYAAFRAVGVPAPRTGYAYVRVNGDDYGVYMNVETLDDVALPRWIAPTQHLYEGELEDDLVPGGAGSFEVDEGSELDLTDLDALIAAVNEPGDWSAQVGSVADLDEMTSMWAVERYVGHWDGYSSSPAAGYSPNNYMLHSDAAGRFRMLPWGTDQTFVERLGFDEGGRGVMFAKCLADLTCAALFRDNVAATATTIASLGLDALAANTASALAPWQALDPRREVTVEEIDSAVAETRAFLALRPGDVAAWLGEPPVVIGVPDRAPNAAGWYRAPVTIDWQANDESGSATDPPNTVAATQGSVTYVSNPSCDLDGDCAAGSLAISIDSTAPTLTPKVSPTPVVLRGPATATPQASDAVSGVKSQSCGAPNTSTPGRRTLTCTATDQAGNTTSRSLAYLVQYRILGFASPPANSKWKRGQTVPVKVALGDATGVPISDTEAKQLLAPTCRIMLVAAGAQSANVCMKYDGTNDRFFFNWKLGQPTGSVNLTVRVGYAATTTKTVLTEAISIIR